jgi:hypothetical protein
MKLNIRNIFVLATLVIATLLGSISFAAPVDKVKQAALMKNIVKYAQSKLGQKILRGECTDLVTEALRVHRGEGIKHSSFNSFLTGKPVRVETYTWGTQELKTSRKAIPAVGSIVQFEGCKFSSNGSTWNFPHHTAIVEAVNGTKVTLLHQNMDGSLSRSKVRRDVVDFSGKTAGRHYSFLPNPL